MQKYPHNLIGIVIAKDSKGKRYQNTAAIVSPNLIITSAPLNSSEETIEYRFYPANTQIISDSEGI